VGLIAHIKPSQWICQAWKNGGGVTHEIIRLSDVGAMMTSSDDAPFALRLSVAQLNDAQPFSQFPGMLRTLVPLDDNPLTIHIDGVAAPMTKHRPFDFAGEAVVSTSGQGSARDFNVMSRIGRPHDVGIELAPEEMGRVSKCRQVVFALQAGNVVLRPSTAQIAVEQFDTLVFGPTAARALYADHPMVWIRW
jgi:environmental stress-induced protein Ves